jgi:hypothetical protein
LRGLIGGRIKSFLSDPRRPLSFDRAGGLDGSEVRGRDLFGPANQVVKAAPHQKPGSEPESFAQPLTQAHEIVDGTGDVSLAVSGFDRAREASKETPDPSGKFSEEEFRRPNRFSL